MGMLFAAKCPSCWERYENCTCSEGRGSDPISRCSNCGRFLNRCDCVHQTRTNTNEEKSMLIGTIGRIKLIKAYQTSDGRKFTGVEALENAQDHQRWLDRQEAAKRPAPRKKPLKQLKRRKKKP